MQTRQWITFGLVISWGAVATLAMVSVVTWLGAWNVILTGAALTSPLGCNCGVDISFWQHPVIYGLGLASTLFLVMLAAWLAGTVFFSWRKTTQAINQFVILPTDPDLQQVWTNLRSQILPGWWPAWATPQLQIIQQAQPQAMSTGVFQPTVFCSSGALKQLTPLEVKAILTHELMHIIHFDQLLLWLIRSWTSAWPKQLQQAVRLRLTEYIECQADLEAGHVVGVSSVGRALLSVAAWQPVPPLSAAAQLEGVVETRLHVLAGWLRLPSFPGKLALVGSVWFLSGLAIAVALLAQVNTVYAEELGSPACLEAESVTIINHQLVLLCPRLDEFEQSLIPMSAAR